MLSFTSKNVLKSDEEIHAKDFVFVTAGTYQKRPYIAGDDRKSMLLESFDFNCYKWKWRLVAWVILDNHYHMLFCNPPNDISRQAHIIQSAHSFAAYHWRKDDPSIRSRIWWNFWPQTMNDESQIRTMINYLHRNPSFHNRSQNDAEYAFSSYKDYLSNSDCKIDQMENEYPIDRLNLKDDF